MLEFRLAHARARDAVHVPLDTSSMLAAIPNGRLLHSNAKDRDEYLRRPDLGRRLSAESVTQLAEFSGVCPLAVVVADGLSALAVHRHAAALLDALNLGAQPVWLVQQGRVAIGDHIGSLLAADLSIVLVGERPGLTTPDSLGVYLTWQPNLTRTDAERNCVSNIHEQGLSYEIAAHKIRFLMSEMRSRKLSGVHLKETAPKRNGVAEATPFPLAVAEVRSLE
jgi:ethanolamine ammonia-lyase small subunit